MTADAQQCSDQQDELLAAQPLQFLPLLPQQQQKKEPWTPAEDAQLRQLLLHHGTCWVEIARSMQVWQHLRDCDRHRLFMATVACQSTHLLLAGNSPHMGPLMTSGERMQGRSNLQCMQRWQRCLDPAIRRGPRSPAEDANLRALHAQLGNQWSRICKHMSNRTAHKCRERCVLGASHLPLSQRCLLSCACRDDSWCIWLKQGYSVWFSMHACSSHT